MAAALLELEEEVGSALEHVGELVELGEVRQRNSKRLTAWAAEGELDASAVRSNTFTMEWPPRSGRTQEFPEIDRAEWFTLARAREKLIEAQAAFVDRLGAPTGSAHRSSSRRTPIPRGSSGGRCVGAARCRRSP